MAEAIQSTNGTETAEQNSLFVLDLGKKSRKKVRRLRKGRGKLMRDVVETVDTLKAEGAIDENAQIVMVVVKQRPRRNKWLNW